MAADSTHDPIASSLSHRANQVLVDTKLSVVLHTADEMASTGTPMSDLLWDFENSDDSSTTQHFPFGSSQRSPNGDPRPVIRGRCNETHAVEYVYASLLRDRGLRWPQDAIHVHRFSQGEGGIPRVPKRTSKKINLFMTMEPPAHVVGMLNASAGFGGTVGFRRKATVWKSLAPAKAIWEAVANWTTKAEQAARLRRKSIGVYVDYCPHASQTWWHRWPVIEALYHSRLPVLSFGKCLPRMPDGTDEKRIWTVHGHEQGHTHADDAGDDNNDNNDDDNDGDGHGRKHVGAAHSPDHGHHRPHVQHGRRRAQKQDSDEENDGDGHGRPQAGAHSPDDGQHVQHGMWHAQKQGIRVSTHNDANDDLLCRRHRLMLAVENHACEDWISANLWSAIVRCGAIPIVKTSRNGWPAYSEIYGEGMPYVDAAEPDWLGQVARLMTNNSLFEEVSTQASMVARRELLLLSQAASTMTSGATTTAGGESRSRKIWSSSWGGGYHCKWFNVHRMGQQGELRPRHIRWSPCSNAATNDRASTTLQKQDSPVQTNE